MNCFISRAIVGISLVLLIFASTAAWAASPTQIDNARIKGLAWLFKNQMGDGSWRGISGLEVHSTGAAVSAYVNAGISHGTSFNAAISWIAAATPASIDGKTSQLNALRWTPSNTTNLVQQLVMGRNTSKAWGSLPGYGSNVADTALALNATGCDSS